MKLEGKILEQVFSKMKERGVTGPDQAMDRKAVAEITGLSEAQVSSALYQLSPQKKLLGRNKVINNDGTWRYVYWIMREPNGRRKRRTNHNGAAAKANGGGDYKIRIDGPDLVMEQKVNGAIIRDVLIRIIK